MLPRSQEEHFSVDLKGRSTVINTGIGYWHQYKSQRTKLVKYVNQYDYNDTSYI